MYTHVPGVCTARTGGRRVYTHRVLFHQTFKSKVTGAAGTGTRREALRKRANITYLGPETMVRLKQPFEFICVKT